MGVQDFGTVARHKTTGTKATVISSFTLKNIRASGIALLM